MTDLPRERRRQLDSCLDPPYHAACDAATAYVRSQAGTILDAVGFFDLSSRPRTVGEIVEALGLVQAGKGALAWLLEEVAAAEDAVAVAANGADGSRAFAPRGPHPAGYWSATREAARAACRDLGSSLAMIDYVAERYPDCLRGRRSGAVVLLKGAGLDRLESYFSAENPLYHVYNEIGGMGLEEALDRLERPARVLELGAGTGGASRVIRDVLAPGRGRLLATDIAPSLLMRQAERLRSDHHWQKLDFDRPFDEQGIEPGSQDVVVGVNALHNATDMARTLAFIRRALSRDGWLVVAESLCPPGERVHQDLIFNLLPAGPDRGDQSRFLEPGRWQAILEAGECAAALHVNRVGRPLAMLALAQPAGSAL